MDKIRIHKDTTIVKFQNTGDKEKVIQTFGRGGGNRYQSHKDQVWKYYQTSLQPSPKSYENWEMSPQFWEKTNFQSTIFCPDKLFIMVEGRKNSFVPESSLKMYFPYMNFQENIGRHGLPKWGRKPKMKNMKSRREILSPTICQGSF